MASPKITTNNSCNTLNLANDKESSKFLSLTYTDPEYESLFSRSTLNDRISKAITSRLKFKENHLYMNDGLCYIEDGAAIFHIGQLDGVALNKRYPSLDWGTLQAFVFNRPNGSDKLTILKSGDNGGCHFVTLNLFANHPTISFACLGRLLNPKLAECDASVATDFAIKYQKAGNLELLDFEPDQTKDIPSRMKEQLKLVLKLLKDGESSKELNSRMPIAPNGWSVIRGQTVGLCYMHKPAQVLIKDKKTNRHFIFGQDEGSYFGCELPKGCKTVKEAFKMLVPLEAKGQKYRRQGEWFVVPVSAKQVPSQEKRIASSEDSLMLPKESSASNSHTLYQHQNENYEMFVASNKQIYAKGCMLEHDEHESIAIKGWHTFYRNTAVRSFSEAGVD